MPYYAPITLASWSSMRNADDVMRFLVRLGGATALPFRRTVPFLRSVARRARSRFARPAEAGT